MKRTFALFTVLLALAIFVMPAHARPPDPYVSKTEVVNEVEIKNDAGAPIPVDVGTPDVNVVSMPTAVEREPFQMGFTITAPEYNCSDNFTTDSGKLLVIEYISTQIGCNSGVSLVGPDLHTKVGGNEAVHYAPFVNEIYSSNLGTVHRGSQKVKIYADPDTIISTCITQYPVSPYQCNALTTISGYYLPVSP